MSRSPAPAMHLVDGRPCLCAVVANRIRRDGGVAVVVGTAAEAALARSAGLAPVAVVAPPLGDPFLGLRAVRTALRRADIHLAPEAPIVAWSPALAVAARWSMPRRPATLVAVDGAVSEVARLWMARRPGLRPMRAVAASEGVARHCRDRLGVEFEIDRSIAAQVPVELLRRDREAIRGHWGARPDECIVGVLAEPADRVDVFRITELIGIASVRHVPVRLVVHPDAARCLETQRWMREVNHSPFLHTDRRLERPWEVVAGLDVAIALGDGAVPAGAAARGRHRQGTDLLASLAPVPMSPLPIAWAGAASVPIITEEGALDDDWCQSLGACLWRTGDHLGATRRVIEVARLRGWGQSSSPTSAECATSV